MATAQDDFQLPADDNAVILEMDFASGQRVPSDHGSARPPRLQIFANGRVLHSPSTSRIKATEYNMSHDQLDDFLSLIVNDHKFFKIDGTKITQEFKDSGRKMMLADAPTIKLKVSLGIGEHSASCYGLHYINRVMPQNEAAAHLNKVVKLCWKQIYLANIGGPQSIATYLDKANGKMKQKDQEPFGKEDMERANRYPDKTIVTFSKTVNDPTDDDPNRKANITVTFSIPDKGDETSKYTRTPITKRRIRSK